MAQRAVPGLYAGIAGNDFDYLSAGPGTIVACPSARKMTVARMELPIADLVAGGEEVLARLRVKGAHGGDLMGVPATG